MSGGAQSGRPSAAGRLVARSRREAVRQREGPAIPALEVVDAHVQVASCVTTPVAAPPIVIPGVAPRPEVAAPQVRSAPVPPAAPARERAPQPPVRPLERTAPTREAQVPAPFAREAPGLQPVPAPGGLPAWTLADPPAPPAEPSSVPDAVEASSPPPEPPLGLYRPPEPEAGPAERLHARPRVAEPERGSLHPARAAAPQHEELLPTPQTPARTAAPSTAARRAEPVAPPPTTSVGAPQVLIDRIEVVTPPARPPEPDPFRSLAAQRTGASRHERARWRG